MPKRPHVEHLHQSDSCGERECGSGQVAGDAGDDGEGDFEVEKGEGGAHGGEGEEEEDDWFSAGLIDGKIAFEWAGVLLAVDVKRRLGLRGCSEVASKVRWKCWQKRGRSWNQRAALIGSLV